MAKKFKKSKEKRQRGPLALYLRMIKKNKGNRVYWVSRKHYLHKAY